MKKKNNIKIIHECIANLITNSTKTKMCHHFISRQKLKGKSDKDSEEITRHVERHKEKWNLVRFMINFIFTSISVEIHYDSGCCVVLDFCQKPNGQSSPLAANLLVLKIRFLYMMENIV